MIGLPVNPIHLKKSGIRTVRLVNDLDEFAVFPDLIATGAIWLQLPVSLRSDILAVGWPILGVVTVLQTAWMALKIMRRYKGFKA